MILFCRKFFYSVIIFLVIYSKISAQENLLNFDNSLRFARYLKANGQYNFASEEYERMNFRWPGDTTIILELVQTYRLNNQCNKLDASFALLQNSIFQSNSLLSAREYLKFELTCRSESKRYFNISSKLLPDERSFYDLSYFWITQKYDSAFSYCQKSEELFKGRSLDLVKLIKDFKHEKYKSPVIALGMSAIIPGSGKAYAKRYGDAFISFLFVGSNAYASYRAFNKKGIKSANGWIFGGLAFSFYSANLWGSAKSAKRYNTDLQKRYQNNAENIIYSNF
jgi:hypothetical protein